ncbi:exonuclease domain-containing protein [Flavobacteriaceae bacterium]|nr:exonuclease domain-containing protein [Flavobacteriaceae bacterium]
MMYSIVDIETTGSSNRVTEISIFKYDGEEVVDEFTTLVNPTLPIPQHIVSLTGIDDTLVQDAPKFNEIAQKILDFTEDTIFVAHNVNFDYNVLLKEFKNLDLDFKRKKLCTVRLSRKLLPGHKSYSLGKLCKDLEIELVDRHRAKGDAEATVTLFELLLKQNNADKVLFDFLKSNSKEATLPPNLPKHIFEAIPNKTGIYLFKNKKNEVIYVGKAKDLKQRVLSHFYDKKQKELDLCRETANIDFELAGSELVALLMEDHAIKKHYPKFNVASKKSKSQLALINYTDRKGIIHFAIQRLKLAPNPLVTFNNQAEARDFLEKICVDFNLCPKYCHLQENATQCNHYKITTCGGICTSKESTVVYNIRVKQALEFISQANSSKVIKTSGRNQNETAFVMIKNGVYKGYGFIDNTIIEENEDALDFYLIAQKDNLDIQKVLRKHAC